MARSIATATISFGLVTIPVKVYPAIDSRSKVRFHWLHRACGTRVRRRFYCPKDDEIVESEDLVRGYEVAKGRFVTFEAKELEALAAESDRTIAIDAFVPRDSVDPVYFEHPYHLGPGKGGDKGFALLGRVMRETSKIGIGKYLAGGADHLVVLRPLHESLLLQQLHYGGEVRPPVASMDEKAVASREVDLGRRLVEEISAEAFDPDAYRDETRERVRARIENKLETKEPSTEPGLPKRGKVVDLVAQLRASLDQERRPARPRRPPARERKRAGEAGRRGGSRRSSASPAERSRPDRTSGRR